MSLWSSLLQAMSSWSSWIPFLISSIIPIISIQFLFKFCSDIAENVKKHTKQTVVNNKSITNKETVCERCNSVLNKIKASSAAKNYHNKKYQTFDDESFQQCVDDGENQLLSSSDDDQNVIGQVSTTREVISYDRQSEKKEIVEICHTKNTVSMLRKQFENVGDKKMCNIEKEINDKFFKKASSPIKAVVKENVDLHKEKINSEDQPNNDYYVIEKTKVYKLLNNNKENVKGAEAGSADKISKLILSKRSHSNGDIKRIKRSPSHDVIAEEPILSSTERTQSFDKINDYLDDDIELRKTSAANHRRSVKTFDDILQQERFSKCYSEYSISDLLNDLPDIDDDSEFASFFNKIK